MSEWKNKKRGSVNKGLDVGKGWLVWGMKNLSVKLEKIIVEEKIK